jgi:hypothetical protein
LGELIRMSGLCSLLWVIVLLLDIWGVSKVIASPDSLFAKIVWILVILAFPLVGLILWLVLSPHSTQLIKCSSGETLHERY